MLYLLLLCQVSITCVSVCLFAMDFDGDDEQSAFDSSSHASLLDSPSFVSFSSASQAGSQQYEDTKVIYTIMVL